MSDFDDDAEAEAVAAEEALSEELSAQAGEEQDLLVQLQRLHRKLASVRKDSFKQAPDVAQSEELAAAGGRSRCPRFLEDGAKVIVCCSKKPVRMSKSRAGDAWAYRASQSGLKSSMDFIAETNRVRWVGWVGAYVEPRTHEAVRKRLDLEYNCSPVFVSREAQANFEGFCGLALWPALHCIPTDPWNDEVSADVKTAHLDAFRFMNAQYADQMAHEYEDGDVVLVYDYELMLLPAMLRKRFPAMACGFFLHCPFPSEEVFQELPARSELLHGILGADTITFNHFDYARHFQNACTRILGLESCPTFELGRHCSFEYEGRLIAVEVCPAGIDVAKFATPVAYRDDDEQAAYHLASAAAAATAGASAAAAAAAAASPESTAVATPLADNAATAGTPPTVAPRPTLGHVISSPVQRAPSPLARRHSESIESGGSRDSVSGGGTQAGEGSVAQALRLAKLFKRNGCKLVVSLDRLDWCQGLPQKLKALEVFFQTYPHWRRKVTFFMVVRDPVGRADPQLRQMVARLVGRVNGHFGLSDYVPVYYCHQTLTHDQLVALYSVADCLLVTSIREGINLSAMEFVACQASQPDSHKGVLLYSEFAGCASSFKGATLVNPFDANGVARSVVEALAMPLKDRAARHLLLERYVWEYTSERWATRVVSSLVEARRNGRDTEYTSPSSHGLPGSDRPPPSPTNPPKSLGGALSTWTAPSPLSLLGLGHGQPQREVKELDVSHLRSFYERSKRRLLVLDYDGALVAHQPLAQLSAPPDALRQTLRVLSSDPANCVVVLTGRNKAEVHGWFQGLPHVALIADHGFWIRPPAPAGPFKPSDPFVCSGGPRRLGSFDRSRSSSFKEKDENEMASVKGKKGLKPGVVLENTSEECETSTGASSVEVDGGDAGDDKASPGSSSLPVNTEVEIEIEEEAWERLVDEPDGAGEVDVSWMDDVFEILEDFTERTPGSLLERSDCCLTWHYRDCDAAFGETQVKSLQLHFDQMLRRQPVRVSTAGDYKVMRVQPIRVSKGRALTHFLTKVLPRQVASRQAKADAAAEAVAAEAATVAAAERDAWRQPRRFFSGGGADGEVKRILVADDSVSTRKLVKAQLEKAGFAVDTVANGQEALEAMQAASYTIVLMDLEMPVMNGFACIEVFRAWEEARFVAQSAAHSGQAAAIATGSPGSATPAAGSVAGSSAADRQPGRRQLVCVLSAHRTDKLVARARAVGADCFDDKPCVPAVILDIIAKAAAAGSTAGIVELASGLQLGATADGDGGAGAEVKAPPPAAPSAFMSLSKYVRGLSPHVSSLVGAATRSGASSNNSSFKSSLSHDSLASAASATSSKSSGAGWRGGTASGRAPAIRRFEMVLSISDDRTHEDLPSVWRGKGAALAEQITHGQLFAVSSTGGTTIKTRSARWTVAESSEVLVVLKALAEVSLNGHGTSMALTQATLMSLMSHGSGSSLSSTSLGSRR